MRYGEVQSIAHFYFIFCFFNVIFKVRIAAAVK